MAEVLISAVILLAGTLATLVLMGNAGASLSKSRGREAAVNLARELLETSHDTTYAQIGSPNWFKPSLANTSGQTGSISSDQNNTLHTSIQRRGVTFDVSVAACSLDDPGDGYGTHGSTGRAWCSDSAATGSQDAQPEDFKRVSVDVAWTYGQRQQAPIDQTATFGADGSVVGPTVSNLTITSPSGLSPTQPVITSQSTTTVTFQATSAGASSMKFFVDGAEQSSGITSSGSGTWSFNWSIGQLTDGVYTVSAVGIDALGNRGQPRSIQVKLARDTPAPPQNVTGGYNNVYSSGTKTLAVELAWDPSSEGSVTGYEVDRGTSVICSPSLAVSCIDLNPPSSGTATYTVKTIYTDGAGNSNWVSTTYNAPAPSWAPPSLVKNIGQASCGTTSTTITVPSGGVAAGNRAIVRLELRAGNGTASGAVSATDSKGNTYATDLDNSNGTNRIVVLNANIGTALVSGNTITVTHPSASSSAVVADEFTNIATSSAVDATGMNSGSGTTSPTASVTTTSQPDLLVGAVAQANNMSTTQPSGWSALASPGVSCGNGANGNSTNPGGYRSAATTGSYTYNPTMGSTGSWAAGIIAYKHGSATTLPQPGTPTGLTVTVNSDGSKTLTWTAPGGVPAPDFYRIYRDGINYTNRVDTAGATGSSVSWTDTSTGNSSHTYRVTAASATLTESDFAGPVTG